MSEAHNVIQSQPMFLGHVVTEPVLVLEEPPLEVIRRIPELTSTLKGRPTPAVGREVTIHGQLVTVTFHRVNNLVWTVREL